LNVLSVGELLWDVFGEQEFLGGAPLNFSVASQRLDNPAIFLTGIGADRLGAQALQSMEAYSLATCFVQVVAGFPTGIAKVTTDAAGNASFVIPRPAAFDCVRLDGPRLTAIRDTHPDWLYFGTLAQTNPRSEGLLKQLVAAMPGVKCFYDINLRQGHWDLFLVRRLSRMASIVKLNDSEAETLFAMDCPSLPFSLEEFCRYWSSAYGIDMLCVTLGSQGCAIWAEGKLERFAGHSVKVVDTVGAGDAFAAAFLHGVQLQWPMQRIGVFANAVGATVASRAGATPDWTPDDCLQLMAAQ